MRAVIQRVSEAFVKVSNREVARIDRGFLILLGVKAGDTLDDVAFLVRKISGLRVFTDPDGKMNLSIMDDSIRGEILAVSQFTLLGDVRKGRRPSFVNAEEPVKAEELFQVFVKGLQDCNIVVKTGVFGAMMEVGLVNDGPVTLIVDSMDRPH